MEADDLLCSRNARPEKALARANGTSRRASGWAGERKLRAVEDQSAPIPGEGTSKPGRIIYVFKHGPADVRSPVDRVDPFHGSGVMLIRLRCRTGIRYPIQNKGVNRPAARYPKVCYADSTPDLRVLRGSVYL
jgi:hypothetical protein